MLRRRGMRRAAVALLAMLLSACSANADILEASTQGDERTLNLIVDTCNADLTIEVEESRSRVVVTVKARNDTSDDCLDGVVVHLDQPLGDRRLLDGGTEGLVPVKRDDP
jgi:outer membrane murein-binding lipoprotein Lpp